MFMVDLWLEQVPVVQTCSFESDKLTLKRLFKYMSAKHTTLRLTSDELNALARASDAKWGESRQVPRGVAVRWLAENYLDEVDE